MASELQGVAELTRKLNRIDAALVVKSMRSILFKSTTPVLNQMKSKVPVGTQAHRTYKKRLVAPGFSRRSIRRVTGKKYLSQGKLSIAIGVRAEDFYAIRFYDQGPYTISRRRQSTSVKARGHVGNRRRHINIKPYTLNRRPWFENVFRANENQMLSSIKKYLKIEVDKAARNG